MKAQQNQINFRSTIKNTYPYYSNNKVLRIFQKTDDSCGSVLLVVIIKRDFNYFHV